MPARLRLRGLRSAHAAAACRVAAAAVAEPTCGRRVRGRQLHGLHHRRLAGNLLAADAVLRPRDARLDDHYDLPCDLRRLRFIVIGLAAAAVAEPAAAFHGPVHEHVLLRE